MAKARKRPHVTDEQRREAGRWKEWTAVANRELNAEHLLRRMQEQAREVIKKTSVVEGEDGSRSIPPVVDHAQEVLARVGDARREAEQGHVFEAMAHAIQADRAYQAMRFEPARPIFHEAMKGRVRWGDCWVKPTKQERKLLDLIHRRGRPHIADAQRALGVDDRAIRQRVHQLNKKLKEEGSDSVVGIGEGRRLEVKPNDSASGQSYEGS